MRAGRLIRLRKTGDCAVEKIAVGYELMVVKRKRTYPKLKEQRRVNALRSSVCKGHGVCIVLIALMSFSLCAEEGNDAIAPALRLGKRLFLEKRFTNPASNFAANCYACHRPEWAPEGRRAYSDLLRYSLIPTDSFGRKLTTLRNAPSLMDVAGHARFNHDGRFASLPDAIAAEFTSPHLGWLPEERETALDEIHMVLLSDGGVDRIAEGTYIEQFKSVYDIDLAFHCYGKLSSSKLFISVLNPI